MSSGWGFGPPQERKDYSECSLCGSIPDPGLMGMYMCLCNRCAVRLVINREQIKNHRHLSASLTSGCCSFCDMAISDGRLMWVSPKHHDPVEVQICSECVSFASRVFTEQQVATIQCQFCGGSTSSRMALRVDGARRGAFTLCRNCVDSWATEPPTSQFGPA